MFQCSSSLIYLGKHQECNLILFSSLRKFLLDFSPKIRFFNIYKKNCKSELPLKFQHKIGPTLERVKKFNEFACNGLNNNFNYS